jgi:hypothetical protein
MVETLRPSIEIGKQYLLNADLLAVNSKDLEGFTANQGKPVTVIKLAGTFPHPLGNSYWVRGADCWEDAAFADELLPLDSGASATGDTQP